MPYSAEVSRSNPALLLFLLDQSESMKDPFGGGNSGEQRKADALADATNRLLATLIIKCSKEEGVRDYFHVGVLGYGAQVGPAFGGPLSGRDLVPLSEIANNPIRVDQRSRKVSDGAGGILEQPFRFPVWIDPVHNNGTPMYQALSKAKGLVQNWVGQHANCFPPIVINITDGEATDANEGDPVAAAEAIKALSVNDGNVLLFNIHLSSKQAATTEFPDSEATLPDQFAQQLFRMSSPLPPHQLTAAQQSKYPVSAGSRGFVFNADMVALVSFLDIGTRPSNLR